MRVVLIGRPATGDLGQLLAAALGVPHFTAETTLPSDGFVLEGFPRTVAEARAIDAALDARAASVDVALWVTGAELEGEAAILDHYRGRVVEVDLGEGDDPRDRALEAIREALLTLA